MIGKGQKVAVATEHECCMCGSPVSEWHHANQEHRCNACWKRLIQERWLGELVHGVLRSCNEDTVPRAILALERVLSVVFD